MSSISSINSRMNDMYGKIASGRKLQRASDGAAELAMSEKEKSIVGGYNAGSNNIGAGKDMLNIADGAMGSITDSLQRMKELAIQASNGTMSASDKKSIQNEIDQLKEGIAQVSTTTKYNEMNVLDGTTGDVNIVADGNGDIIKTGGMNATLEQLGIKDFDVTQNDFDMSVIDDALDKVSSLRSAAGAQTNALDYAYAFNQNAAYNSTAAQSRLEDLDIPKAISEQKKQQTLEQYRMVMQKKAMDDNHQRTLGLFQ